MSKETLVQQKLKEFISNPESQENGLHLVITSPEYNQKKILCASHIKTEARKIVCVAVHESRDDSELLGWKETLKHHDKCVVHVTAYKDINASLKDFMRKNADVLIIDERLVFDDTRQLIEAAMTGRKIIALLSGLNIERVMSVFIGNESKLNNSFIHVLNSAIFIATDDSDNITNFNTLNLDKNLKKDCFLKSASGRDELIGYLKELEQTNI